MAAQKPNSVKRFGRKKTAVAVTRCKAGRGLIKLNGTPIELIEQKILRKKVFKPLLLLGRAKLACIDMSVRVKDGGHTSQVLAIRKSIAKALVAYFHKFVGEEQKKEIKDLLDKYECDYVTKFGGRIARAPRRVTRRSV